MVFTAVDVLAFIFAIAVIIKMAAIFVAPKKWFGFAKGMTENAVLWQVVYLVLAAVFGYFLLTELTVIQIMAVLLFSSMLAGIVFWSYPKSIKSLLKEAKSKNPWLGMIIYLILAFYTLYLLFV